MTILNKVTYLTFKPIFHFNLFSLIAKLLSNPILEPTSTKQFKIGKYSSPLRTRVSPNL